MRNKIKISKRNAAKLETVIKNATGNCKTLGMRISKISNKVIKLSIFIKRMKITTNNEEDLSYWLC